MRVLDMKQEEIGVGLMVRSLVDPTRIGIVVRVDPSDDDFVWIRWPGNDMAYSGFYGNDCMCEIVENSLAVKATVI